MRTGILLVVTLGACVPTARKPAPKVDEPKLDIVAPWLDPEQFWIRGTPEKRQPLSDALADPGTPAIVIKGATIMTATGQTIANGTLVVDKGVIAYVGDGAGAPAPAGAIVVDGTGKVVTP